MMNDQFPFDYVVGVDVSKATLDFTVGDHNHTRSIKNTEEQIVSQLIESVKNPKATIVVMEATGGYEDRLVKLLH